MCTCIRWPITTFNEIKCQHSQNVRFYLLPPFRGTRLLLPWKWGSLAHSKSWHPIYNAQGVKFQKIQIFLWLFLGRCGTSKVPNISAKISAGSGRGLIKIGLLSQNLPTELRDATRNTLQSTGCLRTTCESCTFRKHRNISLIVRRYVVSTDLATDRPLLRSDCQLVFCATNPAFLSSLARELEYFMKYTLRLRAGLPGSTLHNTHRWNTDFDVYDLIS